MSEFDSMTQNEREQWWTETVSVLMQSVSPENDKVMSEVQGFVATIANDLGVDV
jgi:hypothetical protein|tara:strand:- start:1358 stop:1519 length:162 start_codon:yes stop_codon:yes gene_type:complete